MKRFSIYILLFLFISATASAEEGNPDFKIVPTARALFDAAAYLPQDSDFRPGICIPDIRLGAKANFGKFEARADVSYRFGKLYPADIYIKWNIDENSFLKGGYFVHQFGLQSATGASDKISMEEPIAQSVFGELRLLGAMYVWRNPGFHFAGSLFVQSDAALKHSNELGRTGAGGLVRGLCHPATSKGNIFQAGISVLFQSANGTGNKDNLTWNFKSPFPTKVASVACIDAQVDRLKSVFKLSPEILWSRGRVAAEGQFYYLQANRHAGLTSFKACGGYVLSRILLGRNASYSYSPWTGYLATPSPRTWEIVGGWSCADLNDSQSEIYGGTANEFTATLNYYLNRWITWRLNYSYTDRRADHGLPSRHANIFQTRIQFIF